MTRKSILTISFAACIIFCKAQTRKYNNEWIDYNKTYYKFKVGPFGYDVVTAPIKRGVVRINQPALAAADLGNVPAEQFQLWKDGAEVPLYTSIPAGVFSPSDFIEFVGEIATGKIDKPLYADTSYQLSDYWNLSTDTGTYFITVNTSGNNLRYVNTPNNVNGTSLQPEKNFIYNIGRYFRFSVNEGIGYFVEDVNLYQSAYSRGEGWVSRPVRMNGSYLGGNQLPQTFPDLRLDTAAANMTARINMIGNANYFRDVRILLNNDTLSEFPFDYNLSVKLVLDNLSPTIIKNDTASFIVQNLVDVDEDEIRVASIELQYPRFFNFNAANFFEFSLPASNNGRYIKIYNFNNAGSDVVLYDATNKKRYIANREIPDTLRFVLDASAKDYKLTLIKSDGSTATQITSLQQRSFLNFSDAANQGNYLIISNPVLYGSGSSNYVQQYANYRSGDSGGHYNVKVIDVNELVDQFAFGSNMHPSSVKNFLQYARDKFSAPPSYAFLIGKGVSYSSYRANYSPAFNDKINLVPVYGSPGSDNLLSSVDYSDAPATPIGRLSVVTPDEVGGYLAKVKQYEAALKDTLQTIDNKSWMKQVLQLAGANDPYVSVKIDTFLAGYKNVIGDTLFGGFVNTYSKTADPSGYAASLQDFTNRYNNGSALIEYFGHSSTSSIDFSLDNPANYTNTGRYPVFVVNGCLAGNIFDFDWNRFVYRNTISEKFTLEPQKGAIAYVSSSSYGVLDYLGVFTDYIYSSMSAAQYGNGIGNVLKEGITNSLEHYQYADFIANMHAEQITLHGDPALKFSNFALPDYVIEAPQISVSPSYLNVANDSFTCKVKLYNLGRAVSDSVLFNLYRKYPYGDSVIVFSKKIKISSIDSFEIKLPVVSNRDKGHTILTAVIDDDKKVIETSEANNKASFDLYIAPKDLLPVSPYNFAIVNAGIVNLIASTANSTDSLTKYIAEVDTTALFNSPLKISATAIAKGGIVEFDNISLALNNTAYYWRVSEDSADKHWNMFSLTHRNPGNEGFEQYHFYQHTQSAFDNIVADSVARKFKFGSGLTNFFIQHSIYPTSGLEDAQFSISENGSIISWSACVGSSIIFNIFDPLTLEPVENTTNPYGAAYPCDTMRQFNFEYSTQDYINRKNAMDFLDYYVQNGYYVIARKIYDLGNADWAPTVWAKDTIYYGHNNSLYHRLKDQGTSIDSFTYPRTFIFMFKKNDSANFKPISVFSQGLYDRISLSNNVITTDTVGTVTSPKFGPGKSWSKVKWSGYAENKNATASMDVIGIDNSGADTLLYKLDTSQHELNISSINAAAYPYLQLRMHTKDSITVKPYQLTDWSIEFQPVPEGAIDLNEGASLPDFVSVDHDVNVAFDTLNGYIVFKNISSTAFTPLKIKFVLYDSVNNPHEFDLPRTRALPANDTVHISFLVNVTALPAGTYNMYIEVNPDNDQPEQYHFNNSLYHYLIIDRTGLLPVRLLQFTAQPQNKNVALKWVTSDEANLNKYELQYSTKGTEFTTICTAKAANIAGSVHAYTWLHTQPANGKNYYRLKIINNDGSYSYSPVREVMFSSNGITLYPNPASSTVYINAATDSKMTVRIFSIGGSLLLQKTFSGNTGISISELAKGIYIVQVSGNGDVQSFKLQKGD